MTHTSKFEPNVAINSDEELAAQAAKDQAEFAAIDPKSLLGYVTITVLAEGEGGIVANVTSGGGGKERVAMSLAFIGHMKHALGATEEEQQ